MSLSDVASIINIAEFCGRLISHLRKKKKKSKTVPKRHKQTKEEELIKELLANPEQAIKKMSAEYVVKNRKRIIGNIVKYVADQL